jgi:hypothetical protein
MRGCIIPCAHVANQLVVVPVLQQISQNGYQVVSGPFELGEVSFHSGWTFHRANGNASETAREVFTIIYIDQVSHTHPAR